MTENKKLPAPIQAKMGSGLQLTTIDDIQRAAKLFIASGMFAEKNLERDMATACVKLIAGQELGLSPFQSMRGIDIVKGQPTFRYQLVGAKIKQSGRYDFKPVEVSATRAAIEFYDHGRPVYLSEFTIEDAKRQELAGKDNYRKFPRDMLYARALTNGANKVCPEIFFAQCYSPEDFGETSGEMFATEADVTVQEPEPLRTTAWAPTTDDWYALRKEAEEKGCDMLEFETFVQANKGKGLGPAGIYNRTKELFLGGHNDEPNSDDIGADLDSGFADAISDDRR